MERDLLGSEKMEGAGIFLIEFGSSKERSVS